MRYSKILVDNINNEKARIDYIYSSTDKAILNELIRDINEFLSTDFHYLAELDAFDIKKSIFHHLMLQLRHIFMLGTIMH